MRREATMMIPMRLAPGYRGRPGELRLGLVLFAWLLLAHAAPAARAATRLGLHVTQEELNCWRQRAGVVANGSLTPNCSNAEMMNGFTFQNIYNSRIKANADTFKNAAHPGGDGYWVGYTGSGCVPANNQSINPGSGGTPYGRGNGAYLMRSAFN